MRDQPHSASSAAPLSAFYSGSVFAWPAWWRVLAVLPACAALWLGVAWALS